VALNVKLITKVRLLKGEIAAVVKIHPYVIPRSTIPIERPLNLGI
jgi:hypothetical protein